MQYRRAYADGATYYFTLNWGGLHTDLFILSHIIVMIPTNYIGSVL